jgi:AcrR family transcriptional regulator
MDNGTSHRIVEAADRLFYERGFEATSFADIAEAVGISRGNFYYHFKTKDEILHAVICHRLDDTRQLLGRWGREGKTPKARIECFIRIVVTNQAKIRLYGCPVGTLSAELAKLGHPSRNEARKLFELFRVWLRQQFAELGQEKDADGLALHVLSQSQGISSVFNAFKDDRFVHREVQTLSHWLDGIAAPRRPRAHRPRPRKGHVS